MGECCLPSAQAESRNTHALRTEMTMVSFQQGKFGKKDKRYSSRHAEELCNALADLHRFVLYVQTDGHVILHSEEETEQ